MVHAKVACRAVRHELSRRTQGSITSDIGAAAVRALKHVVAALVADVTTTAYLVANGEELVGCSLAE